jgi:hypothetical protein
VVVDALEVDPPALEELGQLSARGAGRLLVDGQLAQALNLAIWSREARSAVLRSLRKTLLFADS